LEKKIVTNFPRLLLVTGIPPGSGCVGEIILRDICRFYQQGHICCFAVTGKNFLYNPEPDLDWLETRIRLQRHEFAYRPLNGRLGSIIALSVSKLLFKPYVKKLVDDAVNFGLENRIEKVWMVLDAATIIAMGPDIAQRLGVPLISLVWDPPDYLLKNRRMDHLTRSKLLKCFGNTLRQSERVAVVSENMKEEYTREFGCETLILRHGLPQENRKGAVDRPTSQSVFVLGFAGALYAYSAWQGLMNALESINWNLNGRKIVMRMLGSDFRFKSKSKANIQYLGWRSTSETAEILADCDLNYLPHPFEPFLQDFASYSFPTKLSTYVATGRPVFIHAPKYSSLSSFYKDNPIGICCNSLDPVEIVAELDKLVGNQDLYTHAAHQATDVARTEFNMELFYRRFKEFVGIE
jgi:glycosyltransferase involved in cell wall biosynthesis